MRINILALGSLGDVLPCAALGGGLVQARHQVRLASFEGFRTLAARYDLEFSRSAGISRRF